MQVSGDIYLNAATLLVGVGTLVAYALYRSTRRPAGFPPGPAALPLVGNIPQFYFAKSTLQVFKKLWQKYGAVYSLKFASTNIVVLNTIDVVKEAFIKQAAVFAGRPESYSFGLFTEGFKDIAFSTYGPQWRYQRKLGHTAIRHFAQKERLEQLVFSVTPGIAKTLDEMGDKPFAPKWTIGRIVYNVLATLCFAKTYEFNDPDLLNWIDLNTEITKAFGNGLPGDFMTIFQYIPTPGDTKFRRLLKHLRQTYREEFQRHRQTFDPENIRDFVDSLLLTQKENIEAGEEGADRLTDTHLVQTVSDIFGAGTETTILTLHWAVLLIAEYPEIQEKVAMEIDEVIGHDRMPSLTDRGSVPFTEATLLEIFRFGTVAPVGVLHSAMAASSNPSPASSSITTPRLQGNSAGSVTPSSAGNTNPPVFHAPSWPLAAQWGAPYLWGQGAWNSFSLYPSTAFGQPVPSLPSGPVLPYMFDPWGFPLAKPPPVASQGANFNFSATPSSAYVAASRNFGVCSSNTAEPIQLQPF